jgi:nucleoside-diphosphate-sugar epimerase
MAHDPKLLAGQKILVTGAAGFLGSNLCRALARDGAEVCAVSRRISPSFPGSVEFRKADFSDLAAAHQLMHELRPRIVFHLAGHGVGSPELSNVLPTFRDDLASTVNVLMLATQLGCSRIVLAASLEEPIPGSGEFTPSSPYAAAKWACGAYARMFHKLYGTSVVMTRPFMTYGPEQKAHKLIPYTILSLLQGQSPRLSSGKREVDWVFVDDVIEGLLLAATQPGVQGCTIDLGSGLLITIREVVEEITRLTGTNLLPNFGAITDRHVEQVRVANTAYAWKKLRWRAKTPLREGLQKTVEWYRDSVARATIASPAAHG